MNLTNHFLVAMPGMKDPYFQHSVIYICEHNEEGAMGLMINAPIDITVGKMLEQVDVQPVHPQLNTSSLTKPVYNGGPVAEDRGFILHRPKDFYESSLQMTEQISVTTSKDILTVLGTEAEPSSYIVALGYSGWSAGQLEAELAENSWLTVEANPDIIFDTPIAMRWQKAVQMLGIHASQLSAQAGHA
ncbi:YqgE/AlgH family protein [Vibrio vulnificus]|uniref:YqgE/AlgH family protein n=1 Tax=Vibrio vulnificus TaxID=672 RepID=UPI001A181C33|nr:YqgE/AlgH family protein [Vibrio vulnificus]EGR7954486.1 YqgE/AlgH family protein [Vibrio vulnificus]EJY4611129.1 YqgE/AlgH family protein [Vibrio vulnificus]ELV8730694.1 YqgE/AlgH family protein [Vibrio vulnificus]MCA0772939.1 YqgE/AlgH family protein [Vibrio vulnificus]MCG6300565.1 YqgE/AlgH family protein [Vibrio vulnificus]